MLCVSLSPQDGTYSGYEWKGRPPDIEGSSEILNQQLRVADKGWSSWLGVRRGANNPSQKTKPSLLRNITQEPRNCWTESFERPRQWEVDM